MAVVNMGLNKSLWLLVQEKQHSGRFNRINAIGGSMKEDLCRRMELFKLDSSSSKRHGIIEWSREGSPDLTRSGCGRGNKITHNGGADKVCADRQSRLT